jgi:hypothetical protein
MVLYVTQLLSVTFLTGNLLGDTIIVQRLQFYVDMKN